VKILAIDTATENCSAALFVDGEISGHEQLLERGHAEQILPMVDALLAAAGLSLRGLTAIAFGRGPGAFTGVRLAAAIAQGLAFGAELPVVGVSDLRALAQRALTQSTESLRVLACSDARMQEVYWGCFERSPDGLAVPLCAEQVSKPERVGLPPSWNSNDRVDASGRICGAGSGFKAYPALANVGRTQLEPVYAGLLPRAREIICLAVPEVAAGRVLPPEQALPVYLRDDVTHGAVGKSLN
jgi:tRNA threonylcarbamoyladenosine biosynthesis protein TsaB